MQKLSIQIQYERDSTFECRDLMTLLTNLGLDFISDNGSGYCNFSLTVEQPLNSLSEIRQAMNSHFLSWFDNVAIVVSEGKSNWDDYLLLQHFGKGEQLDEP